MSDETHHEESSELHNLLETLDWPQIENFFYSDPTGVIERHVKKCEKCRARKNQMLDSQLADMNPDKRARILELARRLAAQF
jgi:hypothetical protein